MGALITLKANRAPYLLLLVLPFVFVEIDGSFLTNRIGDPDTWFYFGHMRALGAYRDAPDYVTTNYYQTRLPFILPGALLFKTFLPIIARVLHFWLYYIAITASFFYVASRNVSRNAAIIATAFLACDIFFLRATGWMYVDVGVLAYLAFTFAALTATATSMRPLPWIMVAAFAFTCAVFTHLLAAILIIPVAAYAITTLPRWWRMLPAALAGVAACQVVFGVLNHQIWHISFFFLVAQLRTAANELKAPSEWESPIALLQSGHWLVIHIAVFGASLIMLAAWRRLSRFQTFSFGSLVALYAMIFALDEFKITGLMARQGLYATFFLFPTYLAIAAILPSRIPRRASALIVASSVISLAIRLHFDGDLGIGIAAWQTAIAIGLCLSLARVTHGASLVAIALISLLISWRFERDDRIYAAHELIANASGNAMPYFLLDRADPLTNTIIASTVESFTERVFWIWASATVPFPQPSPLIKAAGPIKLFVVSSTLSDNAAVAALLAMQFNSVRPLIFMRLDGRGASLWVHGFDVTSAGH